MILTAINRFASLINPVMKNSGKVCLGKQRVQTQTKSSSRKAQFTHESNKENNQLSANLQVKFFDRKTSAKETSPPLTWQRDKTLKTMAGILKKNQKSIEDHSTKAVAHIMSQTKPGAKKRSLTPASLKEALEKVRLHSFSWSAKDTLKLGQFSSHGRSGSPNHDSKNKKKVFQYNYKTLGKTVPCLDTSPRGSGSQSIGKSADTQGQLSGRLGSPGSSKPGPLPRKEIPKKTERGETKDRKQVMTDVSSRCVNHPEKKSKYYIVESDDDIQHAMTERQKKKQHLGTEKFSYLGVCSKCAVRLANVGQKVEEILPDDLSQKKYLLDGFIRKLQKVLDLNRSACLLAEERENLIKQHFTEQLDTLENSIESLHLFFESLHNKLLQSRSHLIEEANNLIKTSREARKERDSLDKELRPLLLHLKENYFETLESTDLRPLEKSISQFTETIEQGISDCKNLIHEKLLASKLVLRLQSMTSSFEAKVTDQMKASLLEIAHPNSSILQAALDLIGEVDRKDRDLLVSSNSFQSSSWKEQPLSERNREPAFAEPRRDKHIPTNNKINTTIEEEAESSNNDSSSKKYSSILERIDQNQTKKSQFYSSIVQIDQDPLFIVSADNQGLFTEKQTPDLGFKDKFPDHLSQIVSDLHRQVASESTSTSPHRQTPNPEQTLLNPGLQIQSLTTGSVWVQQEGRKLDEELGENS